LLLAGLGLVFLLAGTAVNDEGRGAVTEVDGILFIP
jgi:hypothetical protein